ncbi:hypothetical protein [Streptacidiphilus sp. EB129]|uniref:hypothetical protein n=1 Tax=Streptacidiphilus sp. EB129 TaxID=3156262 RepID=UPI003516A08E
MDRRNRATQRTLRLAALGLSLAAALTASIGVASATSRTDHRVGCHQSGETDEWNNTSSGCVVLPPWFHKP